MYKKGIHYGLKCPKNGACMESGLIFSISGSKGLSILVKQSNFKPTFMTNRKCYFSLLSKMKDGTFYFISDLDVSLWFDWFTKIDNILVPDIENIIPDPVQSPLPLLEIFTCVALFFPQRKKNHLTYKWIFREWSDAISLTRKLCHNYKAQELCL